jgi:GrpB-like predicted nucleotidyltransferase (UPF0157 family)
MIEIVSYRAEWPAEFEGVASVLQAGLGALALRIDHVGSTAVPGLSAKNIIDIQVTVNALNSDVSSALLSLGFVSHPEVTGDHVPSGEREADWRKFLFMQPSGQRRANVHVRQAGKPNQRYALLFRDYLIAHPAVAASYAELKRRLASSLADDEAYPVVKDPAVDLIYFAAEQWATAAQWRLP